MKRNTLLVQRVEKVGPTMKNTELTGKCCVKAAFSVKP